MSVYLRSPWLVAFDEHGKRRSAWETNLAATLGSIGTDLATHGVEFTPDGTLWTIDRVKRDFVNQRSILHCSPSVPPERN